MADAGRRGGAEHSAFGYLDFGCFDMGRVKRPAGERASRFEIDLARFRKLATATVQAQGRGDKAAAAELFGSALAQWSGEPFADVPLLAAHPKATALLDERHAALLRYGEAMIAVDAADPSG